MNDFSLTSTHCHYPTKLGEMEWLQSIFKILRLFPELKRMFLSFLARCSFNLVLPFSWSGMALPTLRGTLGLGEQLPGWGQTSWLTVCLPPSPCGERVKAEQRKSRGFWPGLYPTQSCAIKSKVQGMQFHVHGLWTQFHRLLFLLAEINYLISTPREGLGFVFIKRKNKQNSTEMFW